MVDERGEKRKREKDGKGLKGRKEEEEIWLLLTQDKDRYIGLS